LVYCTFGCDDPSTGPDPTLTFGTNGPSGSGMPALPPDNPNMQYTSSCNGRYGQCYDVQHNVFYPIPGHGPGFPAWCKCIGGNSYNNTASSVVTQVYAYMGYPVVCPD
jgi:hypothetical protein